MGIIGIRIGLLQVALQNSNAKIYSNYLTHTRIEGIEIISTGAILVQIEWTR
jgi:hypothetical protein